MMPAGVSQPPAEEGTVKKQEVAALIVFSALGVLSVAHGLSLPLMGAVALSPGIFPIVIGIILVLLSAARLYSIFKITKTGKHAESDAVEEAGPKKLWIILTLLCLYVAVLEWIHFIPASLIFCTAVIWYTKGKFTFYIPLVATIAVLSIFFLFTYAFSVRLP
jgi:hypothetical protein